MPSGPAVSSSMSELGHFCQMTIRCPTGNQNLSHSSSTETIQCMGAVWTKKLREESFLEIRISHIHRPRPKRFNMWVPFGRRSCERNPFCASNSGVRGVVECGWRELWSGSQGINTYGTTRHRARTTCLNPHCHNLQAHGQRTSP